MTVGQSWPYGDMYVNPGASCRAVLRKQKAPACHRHYRAGAAAGVRSNILILRSPGYSRIGRPSRASAWPLPRAIVHLPAAQLPLVSGCEPAEAL
jgi:hypothetical protein